MEFIQKILACNAIGYMALVIVFLNLAIIPLQAGLRNPLPWIGLALLATAIAYIVLPMSVLVVIGILSISVFAVVFCCQFFIGDSEWPRFNLATSLFAGILSPIVPGVFLGNIISGEQE